MISVSLLDLTYHLDNPKKLKLDVMSIYRYDGYADIKIFFDNLSKNENITELQLNEVMLKGNPVTYHNHIYDDTSYVWMDYIKFPVNLETYVMPESYYIYLWSKNDDVNKANHTQIFNVVKQQFPKSLKTIVMYNYDCFRAIDLSDSNVENIIVRKTCLSMSSYVRCMSNNNEIYSRYDYVFSLRTIKFYSCGHKADLLTEMMNAIKLPYGCTYSITSDEYVE